MTIVIISSFQSAIRVAKYYWRSTTIPLLGGCVRYGRVETGAEPIPWGGLYGWRRDCSASTVAPASPAAPPSLADLLLPLCTRPLHNTCVPASLHRRTQVGRRSPAATTLLARYCTSEGDVVLDTDRIVCLMCLLYIVSNLTLQVIRFLIEK